MLCYFYELFFLSWLTLFYNNVFIGKISFRDNALFEIRLFLRVRRVVMVRSSSSSRKGSST